MAQVTMPRKEPGLVESNMGTIGSLVGNYFGGPAGGAVGGMVGKAAGQQSQGPDMVEGGSSAMKRSMAKMDSVAEMQKGLKSLQSIDDPELRAAAEPAIQEALKRADLEQQRKQSVRY